MKNWINAGKSIYDFDWTYSGAPHPEIDEYMDMIKKYGYDIHNEEKFGRLPDDDYDD